MKTKKYILLLLASFSLPHMYATTTQHSAKSVYLFTGHREPALDGLHFLYSRDALHWDSIPGSFLRPEVGNDKPYYDYRAKKTETAKFYPQHMMRDPSLAQGPDGTYHLVWTTAWQGSKGFGYACSKDLIHWSEQREIDVMGDSVTNCVWAPELFYDDEQKQFLIIWSSDIPDERKTSADKMGTNTSLRLYYTTTRDFKTFSPTRLYYDPGFNCIDAFLMKRASHDYVLIAKDNRKPGFSNLFCAFSSSPYGPFTDRSDTFAPTYSEGPCCIKAQGRWLIYFDVYKQYRYDAVSTTDFRHFTLLTDTVSVPKGQKHGTIIKITEKELKKLLAASKSHK